MDRNRVSAEEALARLREGNRRYVAGKHGSGSGTGGHRRAELVEGQAPFAAVVGCSDSRVPAELVFDQGLGDLFMIRVAGNIVAPSQIGSVEFAVEMLDTRLVVVMGHSCCGAVKATLAEFDRSGETEISPNLQVIIDRIRPAVESLAADSDLVGEDLVAAAVRANVRHSVAQLRAESPILRRFEADHGLCIVGGEYDLASGEVVFLDVE